MARIVGAVLAAGAGTRMGRPKAELIVGGTRLVDRAVRVLSGAGCVEVIAVTRSGVRVDGARVVVNPDPGRGMRSSLALAVEAAADADALAVLLVDTPGVGTDAAGSVVAAWRPGRIAVASYAGRRGHPIVMGPALWRSALELAAGDEGARALLRSRPDLVDEVPVAGSPDDLDSPSDLARWEQLAIRTAAAADLPAVREVYRRASLSNAADAAAPRERPAALVLDDGTVLSGRTRVAVDAAGRPLGFAVIAVHAHALELTDLFVDPDRSGRGIGRLLVEDAVSIALHRGLRRIDVLANQAAVAFYRAVGFSLDSEIDTELGSAARLHLSLERRE